MTAEPIFCPQCGAALTSQEVCPQCMFGEVLSELKTPALLTVPKRLLGEYELLEEIGEGGMGVVWKARQRRLKRTVALKLIRGGSLPGEAAARRFRREAETAAQLKHPNIIVIHEVGEADEQLFLSMDLAEGGSLAERLERGPFHPREAATLVAKVARGIHHAHERGILHRDLKPANILLDKDDEPQVCDFGLARLLEDKSTLTLPGELLGTPAYLSPETAEGMKAVTTASDTYSLGAILYELLSGRPPFCAETLPVLLRKLAEDNPQRPVSRFGIRIPADLSTITLKCLEKEPRARYPTALALAEDLERWLRNEPIVARPVRPVERLWKWARRKPVLAALWLTVALLLIVVAVGASIMSFRLTRQERVAAEAARRARHQLARQYSENAQRMMMGDDWLRALPALVEAIEIGTGDPRLDQLNRLRFGLLVQFSPRLARAWLSPEPILRAESDRNGTRLLLASANTAEVVDTVTGQRVGQVLRTQDPIGSIQFDSQVGKWAVLGLLRPVAPSVQAATVAPGTVPYNLLWLPDTGVTRDLGEGSITTALADAYLQRNGVFISHLGKTAWVRTAPEVTEQWKPLEHEADVQWAVLLPYTGQALSADTKGTVYLWNWRTGTTVGEPIRFGEELADLSFDAFNPVNKSAVLHRSKNYWILDCNTGQISDARALSDSPQTFGWDLKNQWIALARNSGGVGLHRLDDAGSLLRSFAHNGLGFRGSFSMDKGIVATQSWDRSARIWETDHGRPLGPYLWQAGTPNNCILDPKGRWLLTRSDEPAARLWLLRERGGGEYLGRISEAPVGLWFSASAGPLVVASETGPVTTWNPGTSRERAREFAPAAKSIRWAGPAAGGTLAFTADETAARLWQVGTGQIFGTPLESSTKLLHVTADPTGPRLAVVRKDGTVLVWDASAGKPVSEPFAEQARQVWFSPDGRLVLVLGTTTATLWDPVARRQVGPPVEEPDGEPSAVFSPDGSMVAQWSESGLTGQHRVHIWETASGRHVCYLEPHWLGIGDVAWSPDGRLVASGGDDQTMHLCDARTGALVVPPMKLHQRVSQVGFSMDGLLVWSVSERDFMLWDTIVGEPVTPRLRHQQTPRIAASPDGHYFVSASRNDGLRLWELRAEQRSPAELKSIAHALSAHALHPGSSVLRPLKSVEMRAAWENARAALGAWGEQ